MSFMSIFGMTMDTKFKHQLNLLEMSPGLLLRRRELHSYAVIRFLASRHFSRGFFSICYSGVTPHHL